MSFFVNNVELEEATFNQQKVKSIYFNTHLIWEAFPWPVAGTPLRDWTWGEIINLCNSGKDVRRYFSIGDTKNLVLTTGEVVPVAIGDFYHNTISRTTNTAAIAFTFVNCLNTQYEMEASGDNNGGWNSCTMRKTHMPNILATFPAELTANNAIKYVDVVASAGAHSTTLITSSDRLRLHSITELGDVEEYKDYYVVEGTPYPYYKSLSDIRKYTTNGSQAEYWTRTSNLRGNISSFFHYDSSSNDFYFASPNAGRDVACAFDI